MFCQWGIWAFPADRSGARYPLIRLQALTARLVSAAIANAGLALR